MSRHNPTEGRPSRSLLLSSVLLVVVIGLTIALARYIRDINVASAGTADVRQELPENVGEWAGEAILYCQREQCMRSFLDSELKGARICPLCDGSLDKVSLGERNILPPDTIISRRQYRDGRGDWIIVTIVMAGSEQRSIHRPQQCLPAQGFAIEQTSRLTVPLAGRSPLSLTLIHAQRGSAGSAVTSPRMIMAYWFAGGGHETPDHFHRMAYIAWDNLIHGIRPRWAYISLQTSSLAKDGTAERRLVDFVRQLHPLLKPAGTAAQ